MLAALPSIIALIAQYAPMAISVTGGVKTAIDVIEKITPLAIQEYQDLLPTLKNAIATLKGSNGISDEDFDRLDSIEATIDAAWDVEKARVQKEDSES